MTNMRLDTSELHPECQQALLVLLSTNDTAADELFHQAESHLQRCPECLQIVKDDQRICAEELGSLLRLENASNCPPTMFVGARPAKPYGRSIKWAAAVAAAIALCVLLPLRWGRDVASNSNSKPVTQINDTPKGSPPLSESQIESGAPAEQSPNQMETALQPSVAVVNSSPAVILRAQPGFTVVQRDESEEIPFYWVVPTRSSMETFD